MSDIYVNVIKDKTAEYKLDVYDSFGKSYGVKYCGVEFEIYYQRQLWAKAKKDQRDDLKACDAMGS